LRDGKVVGIAFETLNNAENIGYIIPVSDSLYKFYLFVFLRILPN